MTTSESVGELIELPAKICSRPNLIFHQRTVFLNSIAGNSRLPEYGVFVVGRVRTRRDATTIIRNNLKSFGAERAEQSVDYDDARPARPAVIPEMPLLETATASAQGAVHRFLASGFCPSVVRVAMRGGI